MKKKLICIILALTCALTLAACGGRGSGNGNGPSGEWWETTGTLNTDENGKVVFEDVEIRLTSVVTGEDEEPLRQMVSLFNAEHNGEINVIIDTVGQASFETSVAQRITNNSNAPDLIMSHQKGHQSFADNRLIQPFDEGMEASGITFDMNDYAPGLAQYTSLGFEDRLFGVPVDAQSLIVFYNKDILNDLGETLPENRQELIALCKKAAAELNTEPIAWSTSLDFFTLYLFPTALAQNGATFYDSQTYKADWYSNETNRAAFKNAIKSIREMIYGDTPIARHAEPESTNLTRFLSNQALFYVAAPWTLNSVINAYAAQNKISRDTAISDYVGGTSLAGWFAMSESENANKIFGDSHFFAVSRTCTDINKKAAICEFVRWFTQTGSVGANWAEAGHISASKIVTASEDYVANTLVTNYINNFYPSLDDFVCIGNTPFYSAWTSSISSLAVSTTSTSDGSGDDTYIKTAQDTLNNTIDFANM